MIRLSATVDTGDLRQYLSTLRRATPAILEAAIRSVALELEGRLKRSGQQRLAKDPTGDLVRSVRAEAAGGTYRVATDRPYARIQDQGGTILPKRGKYLSVPVEQPKSLRGKWPRDYGRELQYIPSRPHPVLVHSSGRVEFVLLSSVTIVGTRWWTDEIEAVPEWAGDLVVEIVEDMLPRVT